MRVEWSLRAAADLLEICAWYEQRDAGRSTDFLDVLGRQLDLTKTFPLAHEVFLRGARRAPLPRFPFCVLYEVEAERIVVLALFHQSRHPSRWNDRVQEPAPEYAAA